ncbi:MAG: histidine phosphatase family protein [Muribaculaceae bacterium]|nr:histidine phosphatase family protein [Muribaculaceae bacterium]
MKRNFVLGLMLAVMSAFNGVAEERSAYQLSGNLMAYPFVENQPPAQTPAPEGYKPFHLEHYGRHGSRWLIGGNDYLTPVLRLESAERNGKLTPLGERTLAALREIEQASHQRLGELSDKGAVQHQAIGRRMAENYPEIFNGNADIDAKATVVIRCILSMANALEGIKSVAPDVKPTKDASYADMWFMNYDDKPAWPIKDKAEETVVKDFKKKHDIGNDYLNRLVTDPKFAADSVAPGIMPYLYWVLANTQSHSGQPWLLEEVFSNEELEEIWKGGNAFWFIHGGDTELTKHRLPYVQRNLLRRIIDRTDSAAVSERPSANLRYGHDGILLNAIVLMELGDYGREINDLEQLDSLAWRDYDIIPMAGNFQLVFYRAENGDKNDILVKAMINEREVSLPGEPVSGPYYRWSDVRNYWLGKLDSFKEIAPGM